jgi:hypothetical protein
MNSESTAMESERKVIASISMFRDDVSEFQADVANFNDAMQSFPHLTLTQRERIERRFYEEMQKKYAVTEERLRMKFGENKE